MGNGNLSDIEVHSTPVRINDTDLLLSIIMDTADSHIESDRDKANCAFLEKQIAERTHSLKEVNNKLEALNKRLNDTSKLHNAVLESSPEIIVFALDRNYCYLTFNSRHRAAMNKIWGKEIEVGMNMLDVIGTHDDSRSIKANMDRALSGESFKKTEEFEDENFSRLYWLNFWSPIFSDDGDVVGLTCFAQNVTERRTAEQELREKQDYTDKKLKQDEIVYLSYHDQLTGLYNRRFYEEEIKRLDTQRTLPLALIMADVNGLKLTNDAFGHQAGDQVLQKVSGILRKACRHEEIISRIGGDEFVILLPRVDAEEAAAIIERINTALSNETIQNGILSISAGFAVKINAAEDIRLVYKQAEDEMYRNKLSISSEIRKKTIDMIMNSLLDKDEAEMMHSKRVSAICESIAVGLNLSDEAVSRIKMAGLMHDVGKIGISDSILYKTEELNESEWADIKRHSEIGYRILSSANEFAEISEYILALHERWDGTGYPKGLAGQEIPMEARIIALAEAYDAMTSDNIYSRGKTEEEAVKEIRSCSGSQFDPEIAEIFIEKILNRPIA